MKNFLSNNMSFDSLTTLFSQAPVALAMFVGENHILEIANEHMLNLLGKGSHIFGLPILQALPEAHNQPFPKILSEVYQTGISHQANSFLGIVEKDGILTELYFDFTCSPIYKDLHITGVSVVATDVTDKVLSEGKLRRSKLRFKELLEISDYSTAIYKSEDLIIEFANDQMLRTWGKDHSIMGEKLIDAVPELKGQPFIDILKNVYKTGEAYYAQEDKVDLVVDGRLQTFYYSFSYKPLREESGEIYGIMNVAINVTELVNARQKAESSEYEYRTLADAMPQMVWTTDETGKVDYGNKIMLELMNSAIEDVPGFDFEKIMHPEDIINVKSAWIKAADEKKNFEMEYRLLDVKTQEYIWFLTRSIPVIEDNRIVKWIGTSTNINEFKNLVNQKDTFLGIASHELKTPLTSLKLYAQVLERMLRKTGDEKNAEFAKKMDLQVVKLTSLIADLLDVTKINSGKIHLNQNSFDFKTAVLETVEEMQMSTSHNIDLKVEEVGMVFADRERIGQVINNLISNAIKYSPDADKIVVEVKRGKNEVSLCVKDFGIGMPADKKDKVFEQYYRVSGDEQSTFPGLGLGLYIASQIVERSGGKISVNSILGEGSIFCFSLPLAKI